MSPKTWTVADCKPAVGGGYTDPEGCFYETITSILGELCGFCGCGDNESALGYVLGGLDLIAELRELPSERPGEMTAYKAWKAKARAHFGSEAAAYFFWYWCDDRGWTDHGGSVPGWLTERGEIVRDELRRWDNAPEEVRPGEHGWQPRCECDPETFVLSTSRRRPYCGTCDAEYEPRPAPPEEC